MSNIFEKTCNEINDKLIVANSIGNTIIPQLGGESDNLIQQVVNNSSNTYLNKAKDIISTSYIIFGREFSTLTLIIIGICILVAVAFLIYKYFFKTTSNIVNIKKFELTTDTDNETEESTEKIDDDDNNEEEEE
jgi:hypothetical protein